MWRISDMWRILDSLLYTECKLKLTLVFSKIQRQMGVRYVAILDLTYNEKILLQTKIYCIHWDEGNVFSLNYRENIFRITATLSLRIGPK